MVSIKDVAKRAGVAISTVSKVLNKYPNISEETKEKVNKAICELNYVPNSIASALSSKNSGRIALLVNPVTQTQVIDEIDMQYLSGAIHQAGELGLDLITLFFSMLKDKNLEEMVRYLKSQSITGLVIYGMSKEDKVLHQLIEANEFKIVVVDTYLFNENTSSVWIQQEMAQYEVAKKTVLENNAKNILYIVGKRNGYVTDERLKGMKRLTQELGLKMLIRNGEFSELQARNLTFQYGKKKDAIICASDLMAIGAMKALTEMDIFRPVCGFDGITLMGYVGKQMNTVRQDFYSVSAKAVEELHQLINGGQGRNLELAYKLVRLEYKDIIC